MKKILSILTLVSLLIPSLTMAYTIQSGDTPYGLWGANWKTELAKLNISDPHKLPTGLQIVDPVGWKPKLLGARTSVIQKDLTLDSVTATTGTIPTLYDPTVKTQDEHTTTTYERITDGEFANWNVDNTPDNWSIQNPSDSTPLFDLITRVSGVTGYALQAEIGTLEFIPGNFLGALLGTGVNATTSDQIQIILKGKRNSGTSNVGVILQLETDAEYGYFYDFTNGTWATSSFPTSDYVENHILTSSWATYTGTTTVAIPSIPEGLKSVGAILVPIGNTGDTVALDDVVIKVNGTDVAINGDFENWTPHAKQVNPLTSWGYTPPATTSYNWSQTDSQNDAYIDLSTSTTGTATYAVNFYVGDNVGNQTSTQRQYISQTYIGTPGTLLDVSLDTKFYNTSSGYIIFLNGTTSTYGQAYNFSSSTWSNKSGINIKNFPESYPECSGQLGGTIGIWKHTTTTITIPASGSITTVLLADFPSVSNAVNLYIANPSLIQTVTSTILGNTVNGLTIKNVNNLTNLSASDTLFVVEDASSTKVLRIDGDADFKTDLTEFDFSSKPVSVGTPSSSNHATTKSYVDTAVAQNGNYKVFAGTQSSALNTLVLGATTSIYTVPVGYSYFLTGIYTKSDTLTGGGMSPVVTFGTNPPSYNNCSITVVVPTTQGDYSLASPSNCPSFSAGDSIVANISSTSTYGALNLKFQPVGFLVAN